MGSFVGALSSKPMMRTFSYTSWTLLLVLPLVFSGPVPSQNSCTSECRTPVNPKFQYEVGQTYTHTFETSTKPHVCPVFSSNGRTNQLSLNQPISKQLAFAKSKRRSNNHTNN